AQGQVGQPRGAGHVGDHVPAVVKVQPRAHQRDVHQGDQGHGAPAQQQGEQDHQQPGQLVGPSDGEPRLACQPQVEHVPGAYAPGRADGDQKAQGHNGGGDQDKNDASQKAMGDQRSAGAYPHITKVSHRIILFLMSRIFHGPGGIPAGARTGRNRPGPGGSWQAVHGTTLEPRPRRRRRLPETAMTTERSGQAHRTTPNRDMDAEFYGRMRALVTGGAGFIGSHLVDALVARGARVAVLDNLATGRGDNVPDGVELMPVDLRDAARVYEAVAAFRPTHIFHQAAQASVKVSVDDPAADAAINIVGGLHLLDAARRAGVERVVFASTGGAIYGEVPEGERAREDWPLRPKSPYGASKAAFEQYLEVYRQNFGLPYTVLRYANVYGPRQDPFGEAGVVAIFTGRLLKGQPVQLFARREPGDDGCVRDYVWVGDVVQANLLAVER